MHGHLCKIIYKTEVVIFVKMLNIDYIKYFDLLL